MNLANHTWLTTRPNDFIVVLGTKTQGLMLSKQLYT